MHEALTVGAPTDDESAVVVLDGAGEDLAGRARHLVGEDDQRGVLAGAATIGKELLPGVSLALHIDDHLATGNELVEHGHGRVQESAGIVAQVDDELGAAFFLLFGDGGDELVIGGAGEAAHLDVADVSPDLIGSVDGAVGHFATGNDKVSQLRGMVALHTELHPCALLAAQGAHDLGLLEALAGERRVVDRYDAIEGAETGLLSGPTGDDAGDEDRVVSQTEGDADAAERPLEIVVNGLHTLGRDEHGVRIKLADQVLSRAVDEVAHVDRVNVLRVDDVEDGVDLVFARVDAAEPGRPRIEEDAEPHAQTEARHGADNSPQDILTLLIHDFLR